MFGFFFKKFTKKLEKVHHFVALFLHLDDDEKVLLFLSLQKQIFWLFYSHWIDEFLEFLLVVVDVVFANREISSRSSDHNRSAALINSPEV
jgi:hypothetical protein